jgi:peptidoglycan hydrolase CwlO-like protein
MINITTIEERIKKYNVDLAILKQNHDQMVAAFQQHQKEFQDKVAANQNRYQQLTGAIAELEQLKEHQLKPQTNNEPTTNTDSSGTTKPDAYPRRIPRHRHRAGDNLGAPVVHRKLDPPHPAPG